MINLAKKLNFISFFYSLACLLITILKFEFSTQSQTNISEVSALNCPIIQNMTLATDAFIGQIRNYALSTATCTCVRAYTQANAKTSKQQWPTEPYQNKNKCLTYINMKLCGKTRSHTRKSTCKRANTQFGR